MLHRYCDNITRRDFIKVGALGAGLTLANYLRHAHAQQPARARSAIFVFLGGGPTHLDTFDMKPDAPAEIRGEFRPIDTNVPGIRISQHLPNLARCADKYAILRGVTHSLAGHELGTLYMNTGSRPIPSLVYPSYGAVVARELTGERDLPHFVAVPTTPQRAGYLGVRYAPLQTNSVPVSSVAYNVRGISLTDGLTVEQYERRTRLMTDLDRTFEGLERNSSLVEGLDQFAQQAYAMISSPRARRAFDVSQEPARAAQPFGESRFGMSCLLATRLIEAGVRFVTVTMGGWDTHANNFNATRNNLLPQLDQGLAALLNALASRGLLETTTVYVTGEFGRTPQINARAGRDHWPRAFFALMAGGGVRGGQVLGASDERGMGPAERGFTPEHVAATFYHSLGIDYRREYQTPTGRPVMIVREGALIPGLLRS
jgi:uncharacterized protein (DUF1501 family)